MVLKNKPNLKSSRNFFCSQLFYNELFIFYLYFILDIRVLARIKNRYITKTPPKFQKPFKIHVRADEEGGRP